jgi:uncharacterized iron-regulated membrane protein
MIRARQLHKWIGIFVGIILLMWAVTGIVLMVPARRPEVRTRPLQLEGATLSPQQALAIAAGDSAGAVRTVSLIQIHDRIAYRIDRGRRPILVDAATGARMEITAALAEAVAREAMNQAGGKVDVAAVRKHDAYYPTGSLPVWRVTFEGAEGAPSHVNRLDGTFIPAGSRSRLHSLAHDLHNFSIVQEVIAADWFFRTFAIVAGIVSVVSIITGYWLTLPRRKTTRRVRSTEPMSFAKSVSSKR